MGKPGFPCCLAGEQEARQRDAGMRQEKAISLDVRLNYGGFSPGNSCLRPETQ